MKTSEWHPAAELPETSGQFIEEILIEYQNDLGTFHAIGLFRDPQDGRPPAFIEVLTGTVFDWDKTVVCWKFFRGRGGESQASSGTTGKGDSESHTLRK